MGVRPFIAFNRVALDGLRVLLIFFYDDIISLGQRGIFFLVMEIDLVDVKNIQIVGVGVRVQLYLPPVLLVLVLLLNMGKVNRPRQLKAILRCDGGGGFHACPGLQRGFLSFGNNGMSLHVLLGSLLFNFQEFILFVVFVGTYELAEGSDKGLVLLIVQIFDQFQLLQVGLACGKVGA